MPLLGLANILDLTVAMVTSKKEPHFDWFFDSLALSCQLSNLTLSIFQVVIIDYWLWYEPRPEVAWANRNRFMVQHVTPKPSRWQGPDRETDIDYWAVSSARNTAIGLAIAPRLLWFDDCSIILPGAVLAHLTAKNLFAQGWLNYRRMNVRYGVFVGGMLGNIDARCSINPITPDYAWSNNLSFPVVDAKAVGSYDETYDGAPRGSDADFGIRLHRAGTPFTYDPTVTQLLSADDRSRLPSGKDHNINPELFAKVREAHSSVVGKG